MNPTSSTPKIAIVCALKEEYTAVAAGLGADWRERFELVRAGVGPESAARVAKEFAARAEPPTWVISTGFCGGLSESLNVGDIVVSSEIVDAPSGLAIDAAGSDSCAERIYLELVRRGFRVG